ncbi:hypothetical protein GLAREA_12557 [Glarea lozoyensis ATCC 20868]|uniref:Uncharacterized protein n=2 Tax=Glarea lozoyensis TaxID=101852 RepID=S3D283_GLAL2|nr:uncharacterized protein GLAREA_12557 [Glarea lozoyensis ATCC 20868]EHK96548.1 hypothetical protein M7I_7757 [Glarea lozoyensis 74030]EPE31254.1 hypothetical protein GLAREA_12557 [Glarea lozoyensis ATCC 20868]
MPQLSTRQNARKFKPAMPKSTEWKSEYLQAMREIARDHLEEYVERYYDSHDDAPNWRETAFAPISEAEEDNYMIEQFQKAMAKGQLYTSNILDGHMDKIEAAIEASAKRAKENINPAEHFNQMESNAATSYNLNLDVHMVKVDSAIDLAANTSKDQTPNAEPLKSHNPQPAAPSHLPPAEHLNPIETSSHSSTETAAKTDHENGSAQFKHTNAMRPVIITPSPTFLEASSAAIEVMEDDQDSENINATKTGTEKHHLKSLLKSIFCFRKV